MKRTICLLAVLGTLLLCAVFATRIAAEAVSLGTGIEVLAARVELVKTALAGEKICLSEGDFRSALATDGIKSVTVVRLPDKNEGTLLGAGRVVKEGQVIKRRNLGSLVFVPASAEVREAEFEVRINGNGLDCTLTCRMRFIDSFNAAPTVPSEKDAALTVSTQAGIAHFGRLAASDPEGDGLEYIIVAFPERGAIRLKDRTSGEYEYLPLGGYVGFDAFSYVVKDEHGNFSTPCEVTVKVVERMSDVVYLDMLDRAEYGAAVAMSAMGVMSGEVRGTGSYFDPDGSINRAEFVAMALKAQGIDPVGVGESFFDDDGDIPAALSEYVSYAARCGIVDGEFGEDGLLFKPLDPITLQDAALILSRISGKATDGEDVEYNEWVGVAAWAVPAVSHMVTLGVIDGDEINGEGPLSRAAVAELLYRFIKAG